MCLRLFSVLLLSAPATVRAKDGEAPARDSELAPYWDYERGTWKDKGNLDAKDDKTEQVSKPASSCADAGSEWAPLQATGTAQEWCVGWDGVQCRCWWVYVSQKALRFAENGTEVPLALDLHGYGGCAHSQLAVSDLRQRADDEGVVVAYGQGSVSPDGRPYWSGEGSDADKEIPSKFSTDDVGYLREVIAHLVAAGQEKGEVNGMRVPTIDASRIYLSGYSNGCMMAQRGALELSGLVAAAACASGHLLKAPYDEAGARQSARSLPSDYAPVPIMKVFGRADTTVAYSIKYAQILAVLNGCSDFANQSALEGSELTDSPSGDKYWKHEFLQGCEGGEVTQIVLDDVGHFPYPGWESNVDSPRLMWDFLKTRTRPGAPGKIPKPASSLLPLGVCSGAVSSSSSKEKGNRLLSVVLGSVLAVLLCRRRETLA